MERANRENGHAKHPWAIIFGRPAFPSIHLSMLHRTLQIVSGTLAGLAVLSVLLWNGFLGPEREGLPGAVGPLLAYPAPELVLPEVGGERFDLGDLRGELALIFFGFASCPDVCPVTLATWTRALERLGPDRERFHGIFVTVDPGRDTPEVLGRWMTSFDPSIRGLVGSPAETAKVTEDWGVFVSIGAGAESHAGHVTAGAAQGESPQTAQAAQATASPEAASTASPGAPPAGYTVDHSARTFLVDQEGRVARIMPPSATVDELLATLEPFLRQ